MSSIGSITSASLPTKTAATSDTSSTLVADEATAAEAHAASTQAVASLAADQQAEAAADVPCADEAAVQAPGFYIETAAKCRRLASANTDVDARAVLRALADQCDDLAIEAAAHRITRTLH
jgi:hypothetical protein